MADPFQIGLSTFKARLTQEEQLKFQTTTLDELKAAMLKIQNDQSRRKSMMNLSRVKAFIEAFEQYSNVIEVFLNTSSILCFVWGPMKFCLQVRRGFNCPHCRPTIKVFQSPNLMQICKLFETLWESYC